MNDARKCRATIDGPSIRSQFYRCSEFQSRSVQLAYHAVKPLFASSRYPSGARIGAASAEPKCGELGLDGSVLPGETMNGSENRQITRDSLFLMADLRVDGLEGGHRIKVRNLSPGGMMGEGTVRVLRGAIVDVNIRNVGWVEGSVAWVQDNRFGIAFRDEIDPVIARAPVDAGSSDEGYSPRYIRAPAPEADPNTLRKI